MEKFSYAPGLPGYGLKGIDGCTGLPGLSIYFTNLNGVDDQIALTSKITNNYVLWTSSTPLPDQRTYKNGDLFIDSVGKVYDISLGNSNKYYFTNTFFNSTAYFQNNNIETTIGNLELMRLSNTTDSYAIDSILSETVGDYTLVPEDIYSIDPKNFNKIYYTDAVDSQRNPFVLFIASDSCDNAAIAVVRDVESNTFRFGNINGDGSTRNVNIKFDVNKLLVSKDPDNIFSKYTEDGTVLTNHEINNNNLVTPVFTFSPSSWKYESPSPGSFATLFWDKRDFLNTTDTETLNDIQSSLVFYEKPSEYKFKTYYFGTTDPCSREIVFNNIDVSGQLDVSGLVSTNSYGAYLKFNNNGWMRTSEIKNIQLGIIPFLFVLDPSALTTTTDASGIVQGGSYDLSTGFRINVSTNIASFTASKDKTWINLSKTSLTGNPVPEFLDVSISNTTSPTTEQGIITISSGATPVQIIVTREGKPTDVTVAVGTYTDQDLGSGYDIFNIRTYNFNVTNLPANTFIDISIYAVSDVMNNNDSTTVTYTNKLILKDKDGVTIASNTFYNGIGLAAASSDVSSNHVYTSTSVNSSKFPMTIELEARANSSADPISNDYTTLVGFNSISIKRVSGDSIRVTYGTTSGYSQAFYV